MGFFDRLFQRLFGKTEPAAEPPAPSAAEGSVPQEGRKARAPRRKAPEAAAPERPAPRGRGKGKKGAAAAGDELDASQFLPIERDELAKAARGRGLFTAWFGRRDRIPPTSDKRTLPVDRALVTHGLLTPEQLVEIHQVGDEMDRVRPVVEMIGEQSRAAGEKAVKAERDRRAKLKAKKKKEAAEREQRHAEGVAHRRLTDIFFLGRGVSGRLGERESDAAKLKKAKLPLLSAPADVAKALGITVPQLRWLAFHTEVATRVHYVSFEVPKKSGGTRTLSAPHRKLAAAQQWIFDNVVSKLPAEAPRHGFLSGRSVVTNAREHLGKAVVVNLDLEQFFPSVTFPRVASVFRRLGYSPAAATVLALLCTECPRKQVRYEGKVYYVATGPRGLPQGACTSPGLSNQVARRLDRRLGGLAKKLGISYTRYADDLTFSGGSELNERVGYLMARVRHIAQDEGFAVNESKSRVLRRNTAQLVTGVVVNDKPGVRRDEVRRLRAILHRARKEGLDKQNREKLPHFREWLRGKIAYVKMVRPEAGERLLKEFEELAAKG